MGICVEIHCDACTAYTLELSVPIVDDANAAVEIAKADAGAHGWEHRGKTWLCHRCLNRERFNAEHKFNYLIP